MAAASASSMSIAAITFVPKEEVSVPVGKTHATLYPKLDSSMPIWERAHAYHVNKTAIMNLNVGVQLQLDTLGSQLNMSSVIDGCKADWLDYYQEHWMDFQHNLTILSFHDSAGRVIPSQNCSTAADPLVLKPIQDGNLDQC